MKSDSSTKSDRTRATLRAAADAYFREVGFQAATTAEIARRAGVSEGTVFLHYSNKIGLLTAVTREFYAGLQAEGERVVSSGGVEPVELLRRLTDSWATHMSENWALIQVFIELAQSRPESELAETVIRSNRAYTRLFVGLIDRLKADGVLPSDVPTTLVRDMLLGALEHTARGQQYAGKPIDTTAAARQALDLLLAAGSSGRPPDRLAVIEQKLDALLARH